MLLSSLSYLVMPTVHPRTVMFASKPVVDNEVAKFNYNCRNTYTIK